MLEFFGKYMDPEAFKEARKKFEGVDGRNVTDLEQLLHPGPGIGPVEFRKWSPHNFVTSICVSRLCFYVYLIADLSRLCYFGWRWSPYVLFPGATRKSCLYWNLMSLQILNMNETNPTALQRIRDRLMSRAISVRWDMTAIFSIQCSFQPTPPPHTKGATGTL